MSIVPAGSDEATPTGTLDSLTSRLRISGWLWQPGSTERLIAEIVEDGCVIGRGVADAFRQDLLDAGIGDGRHGFEVEMLPSCFDGTFHTIWLHAAGDRGRAIGEQRRVWLPRTGSAQRPPLTAVAVLRRALGAPEQIDQNTRINEICDAASGLAARFGAASALNLLYLHCLGRRIEEPALVECLAHLGQPAGGFYPIVRNVVTSEEMAEFYGADPLAAMPQTSELTAWLDIDL